MDKVYNFKNFESRITKEWENYGAFSPDMGTSGKPFVVVIPPPNVTGVLHMGHGLNNTIQDVLTRYHRMKGRSDNYTALWVPGSDHAGIATQQVVERRLREEGKSKHDLGREDFLDRTWTLAKDHKHVILDQLKKIGASCDWSRERFTLDEGLSKAVRDVFVTLYERGLIYQGSYLVNWSVDAGTALSDDEVVHKEIQGHLYHICYPFIDNGVKTECIVATTRPETMLGDTAVAVNPKDERYQELVGKEVKLPLTDRTIPIIADEYVDKDFGTGMVKITPAHDYNDYEMGKRHNLSVINILNLDGTLNENVPKQYQGMKVKEARKLIIKDIEAQGLLVKVEEHVHKVGHCYRTDCVVEPLFSKQWFVKMDGMAEKALQALQENKIQFYPKHWENTYTHWMENIRDWCISRQLWWGHRIPVWYNDRTGEIIVSRDDPTNDPKYKGEVLRQDEDVLDTWFSSWLWPFSVMGWPEKTQDLEKFYPTSTLITAYDIIFFWVARMVMAGLEFTGEVPFRDIYIHGLVRDDKGRKMSKSLGNGIDPLEIVDEYGADALRFTLTFLCKLGGDVLLNKDSFQLGSKFANKIWNASRFLLMHLDEVKYIPIEELSLNKVDKWILSRMRHCIDELSLAMKQYRLDEAAHIVYDYFWTDFCDWYVEASKVVLNGEHAEQKQRASSVLMWILLQNLKILHPYLPFITEEIYSHIKNVVGGSMNIPMLAMSAFPESKQLTNLIGSEESIKFFGYLQELVTGIRTLRSEFNLSPKLKINVKVFVQNTSNSTALCNYFVEHENIIASLIKSDVLEFVTSEVVQTDNGIGVEGRGFTSMVDIKNLINIEQEIARIEKKKQKLQAQCDGIKGRLENKSFIEKANPSYVQEITREASELSDKIRQLEIFVERLRKS